MTVQFAFCKFSAENKLFINGFLRFWMCRVLIKHLMLRRSFSRTQIDEEKSFARCHWTNAIMTLPKSMPKLFFFVDNRMRQNKSLWLESTLLNRSCWFFSSLFNYAEISIQKPPEKNRWKKLKSEVTKFPLFINKVWKQIEVEAKKRAWFEEGNK